MKTSRLLIGAVLILGLLAACSDDKDSALSAFCEVHTDPDLQGLDASDPGQAEKLAGAMKAMAENAPEEIADDAETAQEGFEAAMSGDIANIDVEEFQAAAERVQTYAAENCT